MQHRNSSSQDFGISGQPRLQVPPDIPSAPSSATSSPSRLRASPASERTASMERAPSASVKNFLGRVSSLTSLIAPAPVAKVTFVGKRQHACCQWEPCFGLILLYTLAPMQKASEDPLGSENTMFYDNERQIWRVKGQPIPEAPTSVGPPPLGPLPTPADQPAAVNPPAAPPIGQPTPAFSAGVQSRYVNTLTPQR